MDPIVGITSLDDILRLGQVPVGVLTLYILYNIMTTLKIAIARMDTVLELLLDHATEIETTPRKRTRNT